MFSRSTGETEDLLGAPGPSASSSVPGGSRRGVLSVHRGQLYYGDPAARPSGTVDSLPPPAASSGRRYQGGVSFDETLVDIMDSSSSDGEYSYVDPGSPMLGFSNNARARRGTPALSALSAGVCAGPRRTSPLGVVGTIFAVAACAVLIVVGLVAAGAVDRDVIPAGITDSFQRVPSATPSAAAGSDANLRAGEVSGYIPRHRTSVLTSLSSEKNGRSDRSDDGDDADETAGATRGPSLRSASVAPPEFENESDAARRGASKTTTGGERGDARAVGSERGPERTSKRERRPERTSTRAKDDAKVRI